jgi:hypothetical protein
MDDEQLDERLRDAALAHNFPPETPREAMWLAVQRSRRAARPALRPRRPEIRWFPAAVAAAALLATGIGIGRLSTAPGPERAAAPPIAESAGSSATAYRLATLEHLSQSEEFLTLFRTATRRGGDQRLAAVAARRLLTTNRLLLDSPAATDRQTRLLLEDLELVLAGIAQLSAGSPAQDLDLAREGIDRGDVMPRLRTAVPAGVAPTQGAL